LGGLDEMDESTEDRGAISGRVGVQDFIRALDKVGPSVSVVRRRKYEGLRSKFAGLPLGSRKEEKEKVV